MAEPIEDYVTQNLPYAQETSKKYGVPVQTILAAGGVESGWGKSVVGNNHFGIKGHGVKTVDAQTQLPIEQWSYGSAQESFDDYGKFLTENSRYKKAFEHTDDPKAFASEVAKAGYSERPEEYQKTLTSTIDSVNKVLASKGETTKPTTSGKIVLSPMQRQSLVDNGTDPDEYQSKINKDIAKGGEDYDKAYRSYTLLNDASQTPAQLANNDFNYKIAGTPTNQFINSWGDDFMKSWVNGYSRAINGLKTAGEEVLVSTGLESKETFEQQRKQNLNDLARTQLTISPDANKDALNNSRAFIASVGNMAGTMIPLVTANLIGSAISLFTGQPEIEAGIGAATLAIDPIAAASSALVGGMQFTGEAYNQARDKGLNHEQALTYSMIVGPAVGALGAFPVGELAGGLWKAAKGAIADNALETILDGNITTAAFRDAQAETTSNVAETIASHAKNFGRVATKDAIAGAAFNTINGGMNDLADHLYGVGDPNKDEAKELFKDALQGALFGTLFAGPAMLHGASNESLYGFIDRNQAKPEKLAAIKEYANKIAETKGSTPEQAQRMNGVIDEMHTVATKYGGTIKDPDARYQIWQFGKESQKVAGDSQVLGHKLEELGELNPAVTDSDKKTYEGIRALNAQKEQLINDQLTKIGATKKPVNFADYEQGKKAIQAQIDEKIKSLKGVEEKPVGATVGATENEPDPFTQKTEAKQEDPLSDEDPISKLFDGKKPVEPKTVEDALNLPLEMLGGGHLAYDKERDKLTHISGDGKRITDFEGSGKELLKQPFAELNLPTVDQLQLKQKMQSEQATAKQEAEKKSREPVPIESLNGKPVTYKGKKGILTVDEGGKTSFEAENGKIYDISTEQDNRNALDYGIEPRKVAEPTVHNVEEVTETTATVNGQKYNVHVDEKGNISGLSPFGEPTKVIKNEKLLTAVEIARNKQVDREIVQALKEPTNEQTTGIAESTAAGLGEPDIEAINEADQLIQGVSEVGGAENEAKTDGVENGATENRPVDETLAENAQGTQAEGAEITASEGDKGETDNKGTEGTEQVKEGDGNEVVSESELSTEPTVITIKSEDSKRTVEVKIKKKAKEANSKAEEKGISLKEQKDDLVNKMQTAVSVIGDAEEITPEIEKELEGHGIKIIKSDVRIADLEERKGRIQKQMDTANEVLQEAKDNYAKKYKKSMKWETEWGLKYPITKAEGEVKQYQERLDAIDTQIGHEKAGRVTDQLGFHIKGDGDVRAGIENLKETLEMTKKEFPEKEGGETKVKYEKGRTISGPRKLSEVDALHGTTPREQYEIAKENYETAQAGGDKKFTEVLKKAFDSAKQDFDKYEKEGMLDKNWGEIRKAEGKSYLKTGGKPIESATVKLLDRVLKKAFPNIKTSFLTGEEFEAKHGTDALGVVNRDGTVDINSSRVTGQTQVHEMGHVWTSWAKKFAPDLYKRGMELAEQEKGIHEAIKADGYDLEGTALHEETLARMIGESGESLLKDLKEPETLSEKAKAWVGEMWQKLTNYVKNRLGLKDTRFDNIKDMPFKDFAAGIARELISGKEISPISSEEVAGIEKDGMNRYGLDGKRYLRDYKPTPGEVGYSADELIAKHEKTIDPEKYDKLSKEAKFQEATKAHFIKVTPDGGVYFPVNKERVNKFAPFQKKLLAGASKNKWTKKAYKATQRQALEISSTGTWAFSIEGNDEGMFWQNGYEPLNAGLSAGFRMKQENGKLIKPLEDFANEGRVKDNLVKTKGENLKFLFPDNKTAPDVKIAHDEQVGLYMTLLQEKVRERLDGGENVTVHLDDNFPDERPRVELKLNKTDFDALDKQFTPEQKKLMLDSCNATADASWNQENPVHKALKGEELEKYPNYYPLSNIAGFEDNIPDYKNREFDYEDVAGHKERTGSSEAVYLITSPTEAWERRLDQGSKYAGMAVPIRNIDTMMETARPEMKEAEMENFVEWWNKKKHNLQNPEPAISSFERGVVNRFSIAALGLNPAVDLKHITTFPLMSGIIPLKYTLKQMPLVMKTYANLIANLDPLGTGKPKTYIPEVQEALKDDFFNLRFYSGNDEIQNRLRGDKFDMPIWKDGKWQTMEVDKSTMATFLKIMETSFGVGAFHGAKDMARAEMPHLAEGTEGFTEFVSGKYRDGITASQPSFDGVNKPLYIEAGFAKARGILNKTLSLYAGQVFAAFNQTIKTSMGMLSNPTPKTRFKFAQSLTNTIVVNGLIVGAVSTARQNTLGSDKEKERDKLAGNSLKAMLGSLPVLGPGLEGVYEKATRGQVGYDLGNPVLETVNGVIKTVALAVTGNESKAQKEFIRIAPELLGVPQTPIKIGETVYKKATE